MGHAGTWAAGRTARPAPAGRGRRRTVGRGQVGSGGVRPPSAGAQRGAHLPEALALRRWTLKAPGTRLTQEHGARRSWRDRTVLLQVCASLPRGLTSVPAHARLLREAFRRPGRRAPSRSSTDTESRGSTSRTQGAARTTLVAVSQDVPRGAGKQFRLPNAPAATDRCAMAPGCRTHNPERPDTLPAPHPPSRGPAREQPARLST